MSDIIENEEESLVNLIVEDGTCVENANSYVSLEYADNYMTNLNKTSWIALSDDQKKSYLISATTYIDRIYSILGWYGRRKFREQELCFPRVELWDNDHFPVEGIPNVLKKAVCEASIILQTTGGTSGLFSTTNANGKVKREKVEDAVEREFFSAGETSLEGVSRYEIIDSLLAGLFRTKKNEHRVKHIRWNNFIGGGL